MQDATIDERFYPATDECDWGPLQRILADDPNIGEWMFMCATTDGRRFYKHSLTRQSIALRLDV
jgi:hypothetical protein